MRIFFLSFLAKTREGQTKVRTNMQRFVDSFRLDASKKVSEREEERERGRLIKRARKMEAKTHLADNGGGSLFQEILRHVKNEKLSSFSPSPY